MKFIVVLLLIAVCNQDALCDRRPRKSRKSVPIIPSDREFVIDGENGELFVDGVLLGDDQAFQDGKIRITMTKGNVYLNRKRIAKYPTNVQLENPKINDQNVDKFEMKIKLGDYITYSKNGEEPKSLMGPVNVENNNSADNDIVPSETQPTSPEPASEEKQTPAEDTSGCTLTLNGTSPAKGAPLLSDIPVLSVDKEMAIQGEEGKIRVNGKVLYTDEEFKKGKMEFKMTNRKCVYVNEKLVARNLDNNIPLATASFSNGGLKIKKFDIRIMLGAYVKRGINGEEPTYFVRSLKPQPEEDPASRCTQTLKGTTLEEGSAKISEIPILSVDKEMKIIAKKGKISVDGVFLYNDEDSKNGDIQFKMINRRCVYLNGKLVARNLDENISLPTAGTSGFDTQMFDVRIKLGGYVKTARNGRELQLIYRWPQKKP